MLRSLLKQTGRILVIIIVLSSAMNRLNNPQGHTSHFQKQYQWIQQFVQGNMGLDYLPPASQITNRMPLLVKGFALLQILAALLIFFGDWFGGFIFTAIVIGQNLCSYNWRDFSQLKVCTWGPQKHFQLARFIGLVGIGFVLTCCACSKAK